MQGITYYIRDAQGNVMSVYTKNPETHLTLTEQHLYGSARLGMHTKDLDMTTTGTFNDEGTHASIRGEKSFELSNHLGNVLSVITDQKQAVASTSTIDHFVTEVVSYTDYYPFGAPMDHGASASDRSWSGYRYGFNGQENNNEIHDYVNFTTCRILDLRIAKWFTVDPVRKSYQSPYCEVSDNPLIKVDPEGDDDYFDEDGNWIHSTGFGNSIRIMSDADLKVFYGKEVSKKMVDLNYLRYQKDGEIKYQRALTDYLNSKISVSFDSYRINTENNWSGAGRANKMVKNIQRHYNIMLKQDDFTSGGISRQYGTNRSMMSTGNDGIHFGYDEFSGLLVYPSLANKYNTMNNLVHEYYHWKFHINQKIDTDLDTEQSAIEHLYAYQAQIEHSTWSNTTADFKETITKNIGTYLYFIKSDKSVKQKFENLLNIKFTNLSSEGEEVTYEKK